MKICNICMKNDILCQGCNNKLKNGEISELDVKLSRLLLTELDFVRSIDGEFVTIVVEPKYASKIIGKMGRNVKKLEELLGKRVKILEVTDDRKKIIEDVLRVPIIGINVLYSDTSEDEKIRIRIENTYRKRMDDGKLSLLKNVLEKDVDIVFE